MRTLNEVARALGGDIVGRHSAAVPGPNHSRKDRSLSIKISPSAPDGFVCFSHAGDDWRTCRDYVRQRLGLGEWQPGDGREQQRAIGPDFVGKWDLAVIDEETDAIRPYTEDEMHRIEGARRLWDECIDPRGTPVQAYLQTRGLTLHADLCGAVLRYHPAMPCRNESTGNSERLPCLVAAFRSVDTDEVVAIHRTRLHRSELWPLVDVRLTYGPLYRAAIKLAPLGNELMLGEGLETSLSPREAGETFPCWAAGSAGMIAKFPVLDGVDKLLLAGEMDKDDPTRPNKANQNAINTCRRRWHRAGRQTVVLKPTVGEDMNSSLMAAKMTGTAA
jgi:hypothetical protein